VNVRAKREGRVGVTKPLRDHALELAVDRRVRPGRPLSLQGGVEIIAARAIDPARRSSGRSC
jgi:hypothetical protein